MNCVARSCSAAAGVLTALLGSLVHAQSPTARFDTATSRNFTIAAIAGASRSAVALVQGNAANDALVARVTRLLQRVDRQAVTRLPLDLLVRASLSTGDSRMAGLSRVARWKRRAEVPGLGAGDAADIDSLRRLTLAELRFAMEARVPAVSDDSIDIILTPYTALHFGELTQSIAVSLEKLNRFERKYGPGAPQLNGAEVALNYVAQWLPLLRPNADGWPSRWEVVTSYVPTYVTVRGSFHRPAAQAVTVGEIGLRAYRWRRGWGGREGGVWRPGYVSFGVAIAGERDGVFVSPLQGTSRMGAFVGWGETKVGLLGGKAGRVMVTRQMQLIPWAF